MKAKRLFLANGDEHEQAEMLGMKKRPPIKTLELDFFFRIDGITTAFVTTEGHISICLFGREILLSYDKKVWEKIKLYLE